MGNKGPYQLTMGTITVQSSVKKDEVRNILSTPSNRREKRSRKKEMDKYLNRFK